MNWFKKIYLNNFFFYALAGIIICFVVSHFFPALYTAVWLLLYIFIAFTVIDLLLLFATNQRFEASRNAPEKLSNGDENPIRIRMHSGYSFPVKIRVIDEIPEQFQMRNFEVRRSVPSGSSDSFEYFLRPVERGEYYFGSLNIYISSPLQLVSRRFTFGTGQMVPTYPSYIQLRKYDLMAFSNRLFQYGLKKI